MKAAFTTLLSATALPLALAQSTNNDFTNTTTSLARRQVVKSLHDNQKCPMPIHINTYSQKGCKGAALIAKDNTVLGHSYDVPGTASIHIDRDLMNNEQIDLSFQPGKKSKLRLRDFEEVVGDEEQRPTATEGNGPTLTKRGQNKHCTYCAHSYAFRYVEVIAPLSWSLLTYDIGCWDLPAQTADCVRLWWDPADGDPDI